MQHLFYIWKSFNVGNMLYGLENRRKNRLIISDDIRLLFYFSFILLQEPLCLVPLLGPFFESCFVTSME
jgi:hypothetical protein